MGEHERVDIHLANPSYRCPRVVGLEWDAAHTMARQTTFRFSLDPTSQQEEVLARHAGAARFAYNQCLGMVKASISHRRGDPTIDVPWTPFDLINAFNTWKKTRAAGHAFVVDRAGVAESQVTGLAWRREVYQQVFEEAAVDCGHALAAWSASRREDRAGRRVEFPRFKKKTIAVSTFRMRNRHPLVGEPLIRIGAGECLRSVKLPRIGTVRIHDDTRRLRRMIAKGRARICIRHRQSPCRSVVDIAQRRGKRPASCAMPPFPNPNRLRQLGWCRQGSFELPCGRHSRRSRGRTDQRCTKAAQTGTL